ncbi:X8 domain-containing protein [Metschnikowia aff. pulcherrima]|uniref:1,3-beta-glucanosyltransferase n=1 Tax=Metschnikowia aff. pulcherrima TaxID=2163413 RepID=A0A4P6XS66_9ASCO|nr:X8 domain-containing protein [Metschnikowia aff. pulcherrima]
MRQTFTYIAACLTMALAVAADLPAIEVVGNKFFYANNGSQFLIRGIAYQQNTENSTSSGDSSYTDPLADGDACKRDVEYFAKLNTNVLRVYAVDPTKDHDECMNTFADAGIYIIADLSEPDTSINRDSPEWNLDLYDRYTSVIDMFANYTNVLGFFAGNEVTNNKSNTDASAFVKAAVRDMKTYIKDQGWTFPVGYSSNDDADTRVAIADYFLCGSLEERADFFGINMYEWCGDSTFSSSGYKDRTEEYQNLTIPVFFSEYGCNAERPRKFTEIGTLFSDEMTDVWSGGIVYMYFEEDNDYGLVSVDGLSVSTLADYSYYLQEMNSISPNLVKSSAVGASSTQTLACPLAALTWKASLKLPPTPEKSVCDCVYSSLKCVISDDVDTSDYGDLYGTVCGEIDCSAVSANGTSGTYGLVSFCSDKEKLSYLLNAYYEDQDENSSACDFDGSASLKSSASVASSCSAAVSSVSANAIATGSSGSSASGSSGSSGSSASGSSGSGLSSSASSSSSSSSKLSAGHAARPATRGELVAVGAMVTCILGGFSAFFF